MSKSLSAKLLAYRSQHGLTQTDLAVKLDTHPVAICRFEKSGYGAKKLIAAVKALVEDKKC